MNNNTLSNMFVIEALPQYSVIGVNIRLLQELSRNDIYIFYSAFNESTGEGCTVAEFCPVRLVSKRAQNSLVINDVVSPREYSQLLSNLELECNVHMQHKAMKGIGRIKQFIMANNTGYIVYDLKEAAPVAKALGRGVNCAQLKDTLYDMLFSLSALHAENMYHTAISPECVFVDKKGRAQLLGFAESVSLTSGNCLLQKTNCFNMLDKNKGSDNGRLATADTYSAAGLFYDELGGELRPYNLKAERPMRSADEINNSVDKTAAEGIMRALAPEGHDRFALNRLLSSVYGVALPVTDQQKAEKPKSKLPMLILSGALLLIGGVLTALFFMAGGFGKKGPQIDAYGRTLEDVPNVMGMTIEEAQTKYPEFFFFVSDQGAVDESIVPIRGIMEQDPPFGYNAPAGTTINCVINAGLKVEKGKMPLLDGKTYDEAVKQLIDAGCTFENINTIEEYSDKYYSGLIIKSDPEFGAEIDKDTPVTLVMSLGGMLTGVSIDWAGDEITLKAGQEPIDLTYTLEPPNVDASKVGIQWVSYGTTIAECVDGRLSPVGIGRTQVAVQASMNNELTNENKTVEGAKTVVVSEEAAAATAVPTATPRPTATPTPKPTNAAATPAPTAAQGTTVPGTTPAPTQETPAPTVLITTTPTPTPTPTPTHAPTPEPTATPVQYVQFSDPTFAQIMHDRYGDLTEGDCASFNSLDLSGCGLGNIGDLRYFTKLLNVDLSNNRITSISVFDGNTRMKQLDLHGNSGLGSDKSTNTLCTMTNLTYLNINGCGFTQEQINKLIDALGANVVIY